jgi:hypothetical protein
LRECRRNTPEFSLPKLLDSPVSANCYLEYFVEGKGNDMNHNNSERAKFQQYRMSVIASWPESETKRAAMASAQAALQHELRFERDRRTNLV